MTGCIGEPISWLRLERHVLAGAVDVAVDDHVAACPACRNCVDEIRRDVVALPALAVPVPRRPRWWLWAAPALVAAAVIAVLTLRPRERTDVATIKGIGEVELGVVRERSGDIRDDVSTFASGDRWKVVVTCPPGNAAWIDVAVAEQDAPTADYPIAPARVACGNRVVIPGAFEITGRRINRVCVRVSRDAAPLRKLPAPGDDGVACVTITPE